MFNINKLKLNIKNIIFEKLNVIFDSLLNANANKNNTEKKTQPNIIEISDYGHVLENLARSFRVPGHRIGDVTGTPHALLSNVGVVPLLFSFS